MPGRKESGCKMQYSIWVTNACNLRCKYCYEKDKKNVQMQRGTARQIFQYIKERSEVLFDNDIQISIHGGEPLLNYDTLCYFVQLLRAWKKDISMNMTTNATLLDEEKLAFILENFNEISISIDGTSEIHDKNRVTPKGKGSFYDVSKNIDKLLAHRNNIIARMTVTPETVFNLYDSVAYLYNRGFCVISPILDQCDGHWDEETMEELKQQLLKLSDGFSGKKDIRIGLLEEMKYRKKSKCLPGDMTMHINPKGVFYPCAYVVGDSRFEIGNIETGLDDVKLQKIREINKYEFESCHACSWKEYCCGYRCKLMNYAISAEFQPQYVACKLEHILLDIYKTYMQKVM